MKKLVMGSLAAAVVVGFAGCSKEHQEHAGLLKPRPLFDLSKLGYTNPDGMCANDGYVYVNMNNLASGKPSKIVRFTPGQEQLEEVVELPVHPETGFVCALGIVVGSDGNLYVNDNQNFTGKGLGKSRILRVVMKDGKAEGVETVVNGINEANGITAFGDWLYVADTNFGTKDPFTSGVCAFRLSELSADAPVAVKAGMDDPHYIGTFETTGKWSVGANGIAADEDGNVYVCNFGDAVLWKMTFDENRKVKTFKPFADCKKAGVESLDGLQYDGENGLWAADFIGNAVVLIEACCGDTHIIAKNPPGDGADGKLHAPSECIRVGDKVYVSNISLTFGPHKENKTHTMSVIDL
ncbi:MAG: SMP-30/gluconolactonase/LRE family protein [Kiritimatiellaeota bacterium]|nr:SMP-30/gluconolactonase/LRE family protein [Kiritimatiellota bacterium]